MFDKLDLTGIVGLAFVLVGVVLIARENLLIAGGLGLVLVGLGLAVRSIVSNVLGAFGMF